MNKKLSAMLLLTAITLATMFLPTGGAAGTGTNTSSAPVVTSLAAPPLQTASERITLNGKSFSVRTVQIDLKDPTIRLEAVTADKGIGSDESFSSMVNRTNAIAAINGTFFNAYEKEPNERYPNGLLLTSGRIQHSGENLSLVVTADKLASIRSVSLGVRVTFVQGRTTYTYFPWGINKYYGPVQTDQVVWFTPAMGRLIDYPNGTKIVIHENKVTRITTEAVEVPSGGYVLFVGHSDNNKKNLLPRIQVGDGVETAAIANDGITGEAVDSSLWLAAVGAGPKLLTAGKVDVDPKRDGFTDIKITSQSHTRSFIGTNLSGQLIMGTIHSATIQEAAQITRSLGLVEAMNLDGGASSALYANGEVLTTPSRSLSNILVIRRYAEPRVQLEINGRYIPDFQGLIRSNTTLVPVRPFLMALGADFEWDGGSRTLTVQKDRVTLILKPDERAAMVNGRIRELQMPPTIVDNYIYLPLRFIVETFGGEVIWDGKLYRASIDLESD